MNIEQLTCTIEHARILREYGVYGKSMFVAALKKDGSLDAYCFRRQKDDILVNPENGAQYSYWPTSQLIPVYTLGEMMAMSCDKMDIDSEREGYAPYYKGWRNIGKVKATREWAAAEGLMHLLDTGELSHSQCNAALEKIIIEPINKQQ